MTLVNVQLSGRWGLPDMQRDLASGPIDLELPACISGDAVLRSLVGRYGSRFQRKALKATGELRAEVRLFVGTEECTDLAAPLDEQIGRGTEISIVLLAPLIGG